MTASRTGGNLSIAQTRMGREAAGRKLERGGINRARGFMKEIPRFQCPTCYHSHCTESRRRLSASAAGAMPFAIQSQERLPPPQRVRRGLAFEHSASTRQGPASRRLPTRLALRRRASAGAIETPLGGRHEFPRGVHRTQSGEESYPCDRCCERSTSRWRRACVLFPPSRSTPPTTSRSTR